MHLKSLTLKGFKSFAKPTTFLFEPGVTCIVGPNGSGKSNVVDALAWVMGEQGAKTLRGGKMEDVIFAGTDKKSPLGRAEVTLTIDNSDGALPIEYSEVTISRTLFRNGGSEYAINGSQCRLLDVQELLSDSGLGREMHVIVGQGQLDKVLHATPEERRGFIEEAAGILKHRRRKEKTVRKLENMEANFTRLNDLAGELRRQLKPLGQQADMARRAQGIAAIVRDAKARLFADELQRLSVTIQQYQQDETERGSERTLLQENLDRIMAERRRIETLQQHDRVEHVRKITFQLEQSEQKLRNLAALAEQKIVFYTEAEESQLDIHIVSDDSIEEVGTMITALEQEVSEAEQLVGRAAAYVATSQAELSSIEQEIAEQMSLVTKQELELTKRESQVQQARSRVEQAKQQRERQEALINEAFERQERSAEILRTLESEHRSEDTSELHETLNTLLHDITEHEAQAETLRDELHQRERRRDSLAAQSSALARAIESRDGSKDLLKANMQGIQGLVGDSIKVHQGFESAIAQALGTLTDALLAENFAAAFDGLAHAKHHDLGRVEILIANISRQTFAYLPKEFNQLQGIHHAIDVVPSAPDGVRAYLEHVMIAETLEQAQEAVRILDTLNLSAQFTVVTQSGDVLTEYLLRGGTGIKQSRIELNAEREEAQAELLDVSTEVEQYRSRLSEASETIRVLKSRAEEAQTQIRGHEKIALDAAEALNRARGQAEAAASEHLRQQNLKIEFESAVTTALNALAQSEAERAEYAAIPEPMIDESLRERVATELEIRRSEELEQRIGLETARERLRAGRKQFADIQQQQELGKRQAIEQQRQAELRRERRQRAETVLSSLQPILALAASSLSEARSDLASAEHDRGEQNQRMHQLRGEEGRLRGRISELTENVHTLEMQMYEKKLQHQNLVEKSDAELGLDEEILLAEYGPELPIPLDVFDESLPEDEQFEAFDRQKQTKRLRDAERQYAQLGRVNPLALEEFAALEQRHSYLKEQLDDLIQARKDLMTIISDLDERMQEIFLAAFEDTRAAFGQVFPILFPGGTGNIRLGDPDDLLNTGIEVSVKPAGKKIERLSLLSGGERSLAAVALLIAIFKARPSPFYIMDEVEAALDDANLGRLLTIFSELRENSQLIVITHQKRTMEIADSLYGVSMSGDGISAVIGQRVGEKVLED